MKFFGTHNREPQPEPVYVGEYAQLRSAVAHTAREDPVAFAAQLAGVGLPHDEAVEIVRDLLQEHFNHTGSLAVARTVER